jgi:S-DNA-T family DNA segregation ATPase FtsK/SpoIIIE
MSDELFEQAVVIVANSGFGSASMIVRKLGIGFIQAFDLLDEMEQRGIVGPADGSRARDLLVTRDALLASLKSPSPQPDPLRSEAARPGPPHGDVGGSGRATNVP